jgi:3'(2'), 5'-bisphosphate nucleotidase
MIEQQQFDAFGELGKELMSLQQDIPGLNVRQKGENGPVSAADLRADQWLKEFLPGLQDVPVYSEEDHPFVTSSGPFWLIDPIDGTKEFIAGGKDYCVCAALFEGAIPKISLIYLPAFRELFWATEGGGAFRWNQKGKAQIHSDQTKLNHLREAKMLISRSHPSKRVLEFVNKLEIENSEPMGSAMKFCRIAEGAGDLNFRFSPTWDWDLAPGYLLVKESGGEVFPLLTDSLIFCDPSRKVAPFAAVSGSARKLFSSKLAEIQQG